MNRSQMTFEDVGSIKALLGCRARAWTETAHHRTLVMGQGVSILVILARESLLIVLTSENGTFFGSFRLMSKHMSFQVLEDPPTIWVRASASVSTFVVGLECGRLWALMRLEGML